MSVLEGFWQFLEQVWSASMSVLVGCWHVWSRNGFDELPKGFLVALENDLALMSIHLTLGKIACIKRLIKQKNA